MIINGGVWEGELILNWSYSGLHYEEATIAGIVDRYRRELQGLIDHCLLQESPQHTPSDYGLTGAIGYQELKKILHVDDKDLDDILEF
jgi:non-ribosomal peptide synthase protein (TIGR01720 family)